MFAGRRTGTRVGSASLCGCIVLFHTQIRDDNGHCHHLTDVGIPPECLGSLEYLGARHGVVFRGTSPHTVRSVIALPHHVRFHGMAG